MNASAGGRGVAPALADFILLNEEIAALVRARVPLESHLARLGVDLPGKSAELAQRIGRRMEQGESLATAIDGECAAMPAAYRAVVVAGVESGQLGTALESLVDTATRLEQLRRVTGLAAIYPLVLIVVASLLLMLVVSTVVPNFNWLYDRHFGVIAELARWPSAVKAIGFGVPAVVLLVAFFWWRRSARAAGAWSTRFGSLAWLPWVRRTHRWGQAATLADLLRLLVERGLPLDRALTMAADATDDARIRTAARELAGQIERGGFRKLSSDVSDVTAARDFPLLLRLALRHADDRRLLAGSLEQAATIYRDRAIRSAQWYAEYLPIVLTLAIGGTLTVSFALLVFWPYASMLREVSTSGWK